MAVTPIKRINTVNGDAQIHIDALVDDNGLTLEQYIQKVAPAGEGGTVDLSAYSTTDEMNTAITDATQDIKSYVDEKIEDINAVDSSEYYNKNEVDAFFRKQYYYANPYIEISNVFSNWTENLIEACIEISSSDTTIVVPYDLYDNAWSDIITDTNSTITVFVDGVNTNTGNVENNITKIVIPRGMSFHHPNETEDMDDDALVALFPNLETIVRIHEDGAVLSYNIKENSLN